MRPEDRQTMADIAAAANVPFTGIWLDIDKADAVARVTNRHDDPSDAGTLVVRQQQQTDLGPIDWQQLDATSNGLVELVMRLVGTK